MTVTGPQGQPEVSVVCVVFNPGSELPAFISTLRQATTRSYQLVIVNNGGPSCTVDTVVAQAQAQGDAVTVTRHPQGNVGYGAGINWGAQHCNSPWLVAANPDLEWEPGSLDTLIDAATSRPHVGALGPLLLNEDGSVYPSARAQPRLSIGIGHALFHRIWRNNPWSRTYMEPQQAAHTNTTITVGWLSGACLLLRSAAFAQVGGFDERYFMFFEDVDLGDRLAKQGWTNLYVPNSHVTHIQGTSWKTAPEAMIRAHHASARLFLNDRWGARWQAPFRWAFALGLGIREGLEVRLSRRERATRRTAGGAAGV